MGFLSRIFNKGNEDNGEDDCRGRESVVRKRVQKIVAENWSDCELRENVSAGDIGAGFIPWKNAHVR